MNQLPLTRNTSNVMELLESKFEEFRSDISSEFKNEFLEVKELLKDQCNLISELKSTITQHDATISILQTGIETLKNENI